MGKEKMQVVFFGFRIRAGNGYRELHRKSARWDRWLLFKSVEDLRGKSLDVSHLWLLGESMQAKEGSEYSRYYSPHPYSPRIFDIQRHIVISHPIKRQESLHGFFPASKAMMAELAVILDQGYCYSDVDIAVQSFNSKSNPLWSFSDDGRCTCG